jgi:hypothetical protein
MILKKRSRPAGLAMMIVQQEGEEEEILAELLLGRHTTVTFHCSSPFVVSLGFWRLKFGRPLGGKGGLVATTFQGERTKTNDT